MPEGFVNWGVGQVNMLVMGRDMPDTATLASSFRVHERPIGDSVEHYYLSVWDP